MTARDKVEIIQLEVPVGRHHSMAKTPWNGVERKERKIVVSLYRGKRQLISL